MASNSVEINVQRTRHPEKNVSIISNIFSRASLEKVKLSQFRPSLIISIFFFNEPINRHYVKAVVRQLLEVAPRFRSVTLYNLKHEVVFEEISIDEIDLDYHIVDEDSYAWNEDQVYQFINDIYKDESKDINAPLWKFHILNCLKNGKHVLIGNIDHAIGDGFSLVSVLLPILETDDGHESSIIPNLIPHVQPKTEQVKRSKSFALQALYFPYAFITFIPTLLYGITKSITTTIRPGDSDNSLKVHDIHTISNSKIFVKSSYILLSKVKELKLKFYNATVNDILMALLTMTLRKYFVEVRDPVLRSWHPVVRATFPINLRSAGLSIEKSFGNKVAMGTFKFDLRNVSRQDIFWSVKRQIDVIKASIQPFIDSTIMNICGPLLSMQMIVNIFLSANAKYTLMVTNVAGPMDEAHLCGQPVDDMTFTACLPIGLYCGIFSYDGRLTLSLCGDSSCTSTENLQIIAKHWVQEFDDFYMEIMAIEGIVSQPCFISWMKLLLLCILLFVLLLLLNVYFIRVV